MPKEHLLLGLEPDNLLAFLALLGFHRCLDRARPDWHPRVYWDGVPMRPTLVLAQDVDRAELLEAACDGATALSAIYKFNKKLNLDYSAEQASELLKDACMSPDRSRVDMLSSLMSDAAIRNEVVRATPFCMLFGAGRQNFLEQLEAVANGTPTSESRDEMGTEDMNSPMRLEEALFQPWNRKDKTQRFRWDPIEDRRYALRFKDPGGDKGLTVHGANRLAILALPLLTAVPVRERGEIRLYALTTKWHHGSLVVQWPVWSRPASLKAVIRMLAGCGLDEPVAGLGIKEIYTAERISVRKFFNFTRAVPSPVPATPSR